MKISLFALTFSTLSLSCLSQAAIIDGSSMSSGTGTIDISALGTEDWAYWSPANGAASGTPSNSKSGGSIISSDAYVIGSGALRGSNTDTALKFSFTGGVSPVSSPGATMSAIFSDDLDGNGSGVGLDIILPTTDTYIVDFFAAGYMDTGSSSTFTASIVGATDYVDSSMTPIINSKKPGWVYSMLVTPDNPGDTLSMQLILNQGGSSNIEHVLLGGVSVGVVPEPATYAVLAGIATLGVVILRRRR